ncbi:MAG: HD domain-containing protein [Candidatus Thermoplasmatota archaeon]
MTEVRVKQMARDVRPGERVDSYFSVSYKKPVTEYRNGHMFEVRVADSSGQLTVKYWGDRDREAVQRVYSSFDKDDVVRVTGTSSEYRGQVEVSVSREGGGTIARMEDGTYDTSALISTVEDIPGKAERLMSHVSKVEEPHMRALLESFFADGAFMEAFSKAPASIQLHGAAVGGLLQHTLNVADNAMEAVRQHPELDRDLVLTGALLHDIGKVRTFRVTTNINATVEGNLLGHIVIGDEELMAHVSSIEGFPADLALKVRHILLAHFGKREWGSPVEPMTPEALAVHEADDTDAKLEYMIARRRDAVTEDDWVWDGRLGRLIYLR